MLVKMAVLFTQRSLIRKWNFSLFASSNGFSVFSVNRAFSSDAFSDSIPTMKTSKPQRLKDLFRRRITRVGPMTIADYMQQSLTNPALVLFIYKLYLH